MDCWISTRHNRPDARAINVLDHVHTGPEPAKAEGGQFVIAEQTLVVAQAGSFVIAEPKSGVEALAGSQVLARDGAHVMAHQGSVIFARDGATVFADSGSQIVAESGARIYAPDGNVRLRWVERVVKANSELDISDKWIRLRQLTAMKGWRSRAAATA